MLPVNLTCNKLLDNFCQLVLLVFTSCNSPSRPTFLHGVMIRPRMIGSTPELNKRRVEATASTKRSKEQFQLEINIYVELTLSNCSEIWINKRVDFLNNSMQTSASWCKLVWNLRINFVFKAVVLAQQRHSRSKNGGQKLIVGNWLGNSAVDFSCFLNKKVK